MAEYEDTYGDLIDDLRDKSMYEPANAILDLQYRNHNLREEAEKLNEKIKFLNNCAESFVKTCDGFSLERFQELVSADKEGCVIITPYAIQSGIIEHDPIELYRIDGIQITPFEVRKTLLSGGYCKFETYEPDLSGLYYIRKNDGNNVLMKHLDIKDEIWRTPDGY